MKIKLILVSLLALVLVGIGPAQAYAAGDLPEWDDELHALITLDPHARYLTERVRYLESQLFKLYAKLDFGPLVTALQSAAGFLTPDKLLAVCAAYISAEWAKIAWGWATSLIALLKYVETSGDYVWNDALGWNYRLTSDARLKLREAM